MKMLRNLRALNCSSAFSWPTWLVAYAPSFSTAVLHDRNLYGGSGMAWLLVAIIGALFAGIVLLIAHLTLGSRHPMLVVLLVFGVAGGARGFGVGFSADALGLVPDPQLAVRALSGAILGLFWLSVATLIVDGFRRHRYTRLELEGLEDRVSLEHQAASAELADLNTEARVRLVNRIDSISDTLADSRDSLSPTDLRSIAEGLHDLSEQVVRPLSHRAALASPIPLSPDVSVRRRGFVTILRDAVTVDPFRPGWVLALLLPSILMTAIRGYGVVLGVLGAVWIAGMAALVLTAAQRFFTSRLRTLPLVARALLVCGVWFTAAAASALPVAVSSVRGLGPADAWDVFGVPLFAYVPVMCVGLAIAGAITKAWDLDEDARRSRIEALAWQTHRLQQEVWAERTRLGRFLHGSVQASLTSTALLIDSSLSQGEVPSAVASTAATRLSAIVKEVRALENAAGQQTAVADVLSRIADVWSRMGRISITMDAGAEHACQIDPHAAEAVVEIAREGITNAIRHGGATDVDVAITRREVELVVTVVDNGSFHSYAGKGLGTSLFDAMCTRWSRERTDAGGTLLTCVVPTASRSYEPV